MQAEPPVRASDDRLGVAKPPWRGPHAGDLQILAAYRSPPTFYGEERTRPPRKGERIPDSRSGQVQMRAISSNCFETVANSADLAACRVMPPHVDRYEREQRLLGMMDAIEWRLGTSDESGIRSS